jgi:uncharacterized protein (TIGR02117 family)
VKDWCTTFPTACRPLDGRRPTHIAIGWGEREIFLNTPTWGDLEPLTALRIATFGGEPVMRVSHYIRPAPSQWHRPLRISEEQYRRLVEHVEGALAPPRPNGTRPVLDGTEPRDAYYEATGTYTLVKTCNSWVGDALGDAGIEMGLWTPFAGGVMKWIEEPQEAQ